MLGSLFGRSRAPRKVDADAYADPAPERPAYAVGDIHGRADLFDRLMNRIEADRAERGLDAAQIVFLGDYVDRGEDSRGVLDRLRTMAADAPGDVVCLRGNHEQMMLDFLDASPERALRWLRNGGLQTLASYGVGGVFEGAAPEALADAARRLTETLGPDMIAWLSSLPLQVQNGNMHFIHAGADPARDLADQEPRTMLWGHPDFDLQCRGDGQWVVHGHTIVDAPTAAAGRVSVDTGAWFSGRLTAARILPGDVAFLST